MKFALAIVVLIGFVALTNAKKWGGVGGSKPPFYCRTTCKSSCVETYTCKKTCFQGCTQPGPAERRVCKENCRADMTCVTTECKSCISPCIESVEACKAGCSSVCGGTVLDSEALEEKHARRKKYSHECKKCYKICMINGAAIVDTE